MDRLSLIAVFVIMLNGISGFRLDETNTTIQSDNSNTETTISPVVASQLQSRIETIEATCKSNKTEQQLKIFEQKSLNMEKQFESLQNLVHALVQNYTDLRTENEVLINELALKNKDDTIDEDVLSDPEIIQVYQLVQDVQRLKNTVNNLTKTTDALSQRHQDFYGLQTMTVNIANKIQQIEGTLSSLQEYKHGRTGFTAYRSSAVTVSNGAILEFDNTWTNIGNAYDPNSGIFIAKDAGLYHFSAILMCNTGDDLYFHIWQNNEPKQGSRAHAVHSVLSFNDGSTSHHYGVTTGVIDVVLDLAVGDRVYIKSNWNNAKVYSDDSNYSTFSGFSI